MSWGKLGGSGRWTPDEYPNAGGTRTADYSSGQRAYDRESKVNIIGSDKKENSNSSAMTKH